MENKYINTYKFYNLVSRVAKEHSLTPEDAAVYTINCGLNLTKEDPKFFINADFASVVARSKNILGGNPNEEFYLGVLDYRTLTFLEFGNSLGQYLITGWPVSEEGKEFYKKYMMEEL